MTDPTTRLDAIAGELADRDLLRRRAELVATARRDSAREHRALIRDLVTVLALAPFTHATDAPAGELGRPIGPSDDELGPPPLARCAAEIPRQPRPLRGAARRAREARQARGRARP